MLFRVRGKLIHIYRSEYDKATKKAKHELIARLPRDKPEVSAELRLACSPTEIDEISSWLQHQSSLENVRAEFAAKSLPEQMEIAAEWFRQAPNEAGRATASQVSAAWARLRSHLKRQKLVD